MSKSFTRVIAIAVVALLLIVVWSSCTVTIKAGHTGVVSTFGKVSDQVLQEGFSFKAPWQKVTKMDNRVVKLEVATEAFSSDLQPVSVVLAVNYRVDTSMSYWIIKNVGKSFEDTLITPTVNEVMKSIMARSTAEESITSRTEISTDLREELNTRLAANGITVEDINIIDFDFTEAYLAAIEAKQVAEQEKLRAQIEQEQMTMEREAEAERKVIDANAAAETNRINAEANAEVRRIQADADAEVKRIEADALEYAGQKEAAANKAISQSLTSTLIEYYKVEQWDGELPQISGADSVITMTGGN